MEKDAQLKQDPLDKSQQNLKQLTEQERTRVLGDVEYNMRNDPDVNTKEISQLNIPKLQEGEAEPERQSLATSQKKNQAGQGASIVEQQLFQGKEEEKWKVRIIYF